MELFKKLCKKWFDRGLSLDYISGSVNFSHCIHISGLGRCYALLLASRGASVVVNDLGVSRSGEGTSAKAADIVVKEIIDKGITL